MALGQPKILSKYDFFNDSASECAISTFRQGGVPELETTITSPFVLPVRRLVIGVAFFVISHL